MKLAQYRTISQQVADDLTEVFKKYGLDMRKVNVVITEETGEMRYTIKVADANQRDADGNLTSPEALRYKTVASLINMKPEWLNRPFTMGGNHYTLEGMRETSSAKKLVIVRNGKRFVSTVDAVRNAFLAQESNR